MIRFSFLIHIKNSVEHLGRVAPKIWIALVEFCSYLRLSHVNTFDIMYPYLVFGRVQLMFVIEKSR